MKEDILAKLHRYTPRYGPEWGSGGIFGMKYYKSTLYFNLAFEAEAHFIHEDDDRIYNYNLVGLGPVSGGDTYNAADTVDDFIYFGGWVHAPAIYNRTEEKRSVSFVNKYSHVHEYDTKNRKVKLVWKDSIHSMTDWTGEVSEVIYNPVEDRLLLARADGHSNLGIFSLDRKDGNISQLSSNPGVKGTLFLDTVCFDKSSIGDFIGLQLMDLSTNRWIKQDITDIARISLDEGYCVKPFVGSLASAYARLFVFVKGGMFVGNPLDVAREPMRFIRLFDFGYSGYSPSRTVALPVGGGILTAFNAFTHGFINPMNDGESRVMEAVNTIVGPTVLVYITPPVARIVGSFGARVTSMESFAGKILIGTSTSANLARFDATPIDTGFRDIMALDNGILLSESLPVSFNIPGSRLSNLAWGGIPLFGYSEPKMTIKASKSNKLHIFEYDIGLPIQEAERASYEIKEGLNSIDIKNYNRILSFRLEEEDYKSAVRIYLR